MWEMHALVLGFASRRNEQLHNYAVSRCAEATNDLKTACTVLRAEEC